MGFNTVLFICNDAMGEIDNDPVGWWQKTKSAMGGHLPKTSSDCGRAIYGFGHHANGFQVVTCEHADSHFLIVAGGNVATIEGCAWGRRGREETTLELLRQAVEKFGYRLTKKAKAKGGAK